MSKTKSQNEVYDCIVVGGGPGGLVAALYLGRYRRRVLIVDAGEPRARWIPKIRNLIGYTKGLTGPQLLQRLRKQVQQYRVEFLQGHAKIRRNRKVFEVEVGNKNITAPFVVLATGIIDIQPLLKNIPELRSAGLLGYCPICDGYDHAKKKVALFVKSPRIFKKVQFISKLCPYLTVVPIRDVQFPPVLQKWAQKANVHIALRPLERLDRDKKNQKLLVYLRDLKKPVEFDFGYVALGVQFQESAIEPLRGLKRVRGGYIQTSSHQETSIPGLYAVGDCVNALAQVSVAIGQAALAATRIHHRLTAIES